MGNEFCELVDELMEFSAVAKDELKQIVQKGSLTPSEMESVYKIACVAEKIKDLAYGEDSDIPGYGYGMDYNMRRYNGRVYGDGMGYAETRGRSPVTGRYISRGYSGHSIEDRMIMALEQQMDSATSDYERKMIEDEIKHIRNGMK